MREGESPHPGVFNIKSCGQAQSPKGRSQHLCAEEPEAPHVSGSYDAKPELVIVVRQNSSSSPLRFCPTLLLLISEETLKYIYLKSLRPVMGTQELLAVYFWGMTLFFTLPLVSRRGGEKKDLDHHSSQHLVNTNILTSWFYSFALKTLSIDWEFCKKNKSLKVSFEIAQLETDIMKLFQSSVLWEVLSVSLWWDLTLGGTSLSRGLTGRSTLLSGRTHALIDGHYFQTAEIHVHPFPSRVFRGILIHKEKGKSW